MYDLYDDEIEKKKNNNEKLIFIFILESLKLAK